MGFPRLEIRPDAVRQNAAAVRALCAGYGLNVTGITKVFAGDPQIAKAYLDAGITRLGDSRIGNLKK